MTNHPLTDEMINEIKRDIFSQTPERLTPGLPSIWSSDCMRVSYDLAIEHYSKWIYENGDDYVIQHYEHNIKTDLDTIVADFHKAMRPQIVDLPQANSDVCGEEGMERALQRTFEENDELMRKLSDS